MTDRMPEWTPWPDGRVSKPTPLERRELYYHNFHDTPEPACNACAWADTI